MTVVSFVQPQSSAQCLPSSLRRSLHSMQASTTVPLESGLCPLFFLPVTALSCTLAVLTFPIWMNEDTLRARFHPSLTKASIHESPFNTMITAATTRLDSLLHHFLIMHLIFCLLLISLGSRIFFFRFLLFMSAKLTVNIKSRSHSRMNAEGQAFIHKNRHHTQNQPLYTAIRHSDFNIDIIAFAHDDALATEAETQNSTLKHGSTIYDIITLECKNP